MRGFIQGLHLLSAIAALSAPALANPIAKPEAAGNSPSHKPRAVWPDLPFTTHGRDIISASGEKVVYSGVNWPGAADAMLPEGLQYRSIKDIVSMVKELGMNVVRLTFAIEMIDDHFADSPNQSLRKTLSNALGTKNGTAVLQDVLKHNPQFTPETTRLQVFDAVAAELRKQEIWVHLDNHVSKAEWCCGSGDGNGWFGDEFFDVNNWERGLGFMAKRGKSWGNLASIGLRNELRDSENWAQWYHNMVPAAKGVHGNNSDALIFFSGINYDTSLAPIARGDDLGHGLAFDLADFAFSDKVVFELHKYAGGEAACTDVTDWLYYAGFGAMQLNDTAYRNHAPVVLTEFGFSMEDGSSDGPTYAQCLKDFLVNQPGGPGGWMHWTLSGSYYIRSGIQDDDDFWGLTSHDWKSWRNETVIDTYVKDFARVTLA